MGRGHARSGFTFKQPGTYVKQGEALRAEARMEEVHDSNSLIVLVSDAAGIWEDSNGVFGGKGV